MGFLDTLLMKLVSDAGQKLLEKEVPAKPQTVPYPEPVKKVKSAEKAAEEPAEIAEDQYRDRNDIDEFVIPEGITKIGRRAFKDCTCLTKITFPSTLKEIAMEAFQGCASLREAIIPEGVRKMGDRVFDDCFALEKAVLPKSMNGSQIGYGMFADCTALEDVTLPDRLTGEFFNVFKGCELLTSAVIPEGVTKLGSFAFEDCSSLVSVKIPDTVKIIEHRAFSHCTALREIFIPDSVRIIDSFDTFRGCTALQKIRLPIGVTFRKKFDDEAGGLGTCFWECDSLNEVIFGERSFEVNGKLDNTELNHMYARLAADGDTSGISYVRSNIRDVLQAVIMKEDTAAMRVLLSLLHEDALTEEDVLEAADSAGMMGVTAVFDVVYAYAVRRGIHIDIE